MESYKLLSSYDKKDDIKMIVYDCRNSDYIDRDLWEHSQRKFADNLKCGGYADRQHTSNRTELMMQYWAKDISAIGTNLHRKILLKKMNDLVYNYKMECKGRQCFKLYHDSL